MHFTGERWRPRRNLQKKRSDIKKRWKSTLFKRILLYINGQLCINFQHICHSCRIEAVDKKHTREWEEDWGSKDRPKSPRSMKNPAPAPPERKTSPAPKAKSSRMLSHTSESFWTCFSSEPIKTLVLFFYLHAVFVFLFVLVAVLSFTTSLSRWRQLLPRSRGRRWAAQSSEFGVSAVNTRMSVQNNTSKTSGRFPLTTTTRPREQTLNFLWMDKSLWLIRDSSSWLIASFCIFSLFCCCF